MRELVGRAALVDDLAALVEAPGVVTVVGPGGVGKTSLAVRAAQLVAPTRADGACFVDLAALAGDQPVWTATASALGLRPSSAQDARDDVVALLLARDQVLVLDNCEHVLDDVAALVADLERAPALTVLATSRSPLGLGGERVVEAAPLTDDDLIELFLERARAASPRFVPDEEDLTAIRSIVESMQGLALGVELVAPLVRTMTPREILEASRGAATPSARRRDLVDRHRSMRDAIDWSVALLDPAARALFRRLGVFAGGATLEGIRAVCCDGDGATIGGRDVVEVLDDVVAGSLVTTDRTPSGTRYRMLHPVRLRAQELLADHADEERRTSERFVDHVVDVVARLGTEIESAVPRPAIERLEREAANVRDARRRAVALGDVGRRRAVLTAFTPLSLAASTALPEAVGWYREEYADLHGATDVQRVRLVANAAWMADAGHLDAEIEPAIAAAERAGDDWSTAILHAVRADALGGLGDSAVAADAAATAIDIARRTGRPVLLGMTFDWALNQLLRGRQLERAGALLEEALTGDVQRFGVMEPFLLFQRGRLEGERGGDGLVWFERARVAAARVGHASATAYAWFGMGRALTRTDPEAALAAYRHAFEIDRVLAPRELWGDRLSIGLLAAQLGDERELEEQHRGIVAEAHREVDAAAGALLGACLARRRGDPASASGQFDDVVRRTVRLNMVSFTVDAIVQWATCFEEPTAERVRAIAVAVDRGELALAAARERVRAIVGAAAEPRT